MPDFMPVLIIAIILFIALLLVFGGGFVSVPSRQYPSHYIEDRTIEFGRFTVYFRASEEDAGNIGGEVSNGVFSKSDKRMGFDVSNLGEASELLLNMRVDQSNFYGKLIILINGKAVYEGYPAIGEITISVDPSVLKESNILEVNAESSGWRIWAPTVYDIFLDAKIDYLGKKNQDFTFDLSDEEAKYLNNARIVAFGSREGAGNLRIFINGIGVYSGFTTIYQDFPTSVLSAGNNTIEFSTEPNTTYDISSAQVILFFE